MVFATIITMIKLINNYPNMLMKMMMTMPAISTGKRPENAKAAIVRSVFVGTLVKRLVLRSRKSSSSWLKVIFHFGIENEEGQSRRVACENCEISNSDDDSI